MKANGEVELQIHAFITSALGGRFTHAEKPSASLKEG